MAFVGAFGSKWPQNGRFRALRRRSEGLGVLELLPTQDNERQSHLMSPRDRLDGLYAIESTTLAICGPPSSQNGLKIVDFGLHVLPGAVLKAWGVLQLLPTQDN